MDKVVCSIFCILSLCLLKTCYSHLILTLAEFCHAYQVFINRIFNFQLAAHCNQCLKYYTGVKKKCYMVKWYKVLIDVLYRAVQKLTDKSRDPVLGVKEFAQCLGLLIPVPLQGEVLLFFLCSLWKGALLWGTSFLLEYGFFKKGK